MALRFEDVTQDGRFVLEALPTALEPTIWRGFANDPGARACLEHGIVPILTRFVLEGTAGPFTPNGAVEAAAAYGMVRVSTGFAVDMWAEVWGTSGRAYGPAPSQEARALAGRVYAEHVLTRPFAPAGERRVTSLEFDGAPQVSASRPPLPPVESIARLPETAQPLEPTLRLDPLQIAFGPVHTDGNMHVNSLAYLRLFEEAALRRFEDLGRGALVLSRWLEIAYRKPCFAGMRARVALQAFQEGSRLGVIGVLVDAASVPPDGLIGGRSADGSLSAVRPHAVVRIAFES
jgi:hypothetical protein